MLNHVNVAVGMWFEEMTLRTAVVMQFYIDIMQVFQADIKHLNAFAAQSSSVCKNVGIARENSHFY